MPTKTLETDYFVVDCGAAGMAITDALITDCDAKVIMVCAAALVDEAMPNWRLRRNELNALPVRHEGWEY